jgi:choline monooxygenase
MPSELRRLLVDFDADLPLDRASTIPSSWYLDAAIFDLERAAVFAASWQAVGRLDQLPSPGSFFTTEAAGEPIVVVRQSDGALAALANVCRHRAARVADAACGQAAKFRCRYHGWTYDLTGRLLGTPEFDGVADFHRDQHSLPRYAVDTLGPLVWVYLGTAPPPLAEPLAPLIQQADFLELSRFRFFDRYIYDLACNWKVYVDNYLDGGYHVHSIHPGLASVLDYSGYRTELHDQASVQISPMRPAAADVGAVRGGETAYYWWVFPNFMLNWYRGVMDVNLVVPLAPDRCRVVFDFYFTDLESDTARDFARRSVEMGHRIQEEDVEICQDVQRGLASRSFRVGRYGVRREAGVHHFHRLLAQRLREAAGMVG